MSMCRVSICCLSGTARTTAGASAAQPRPTPPPQAPSPAPHRAQTTSRLVDFRSCMFEQGQSVRRMGQGRIARSVHACLLGCSRLIRSWCLKQSGDRAMCVWEESADLGDESLQLRAEGQKVPNLTATCHAQQERPPHLSTECTTSSVARARARDGQQSRVAWQQGGSWSREHLSLRPCRGTLTPPPPYKPPTTSPKP